MSVDFQWMSSGGALLDGSGDLATTPSNTLADVFSIVQTRLKSAVNGWKLYQFGADLDAVVGQSIQPELTTAVQRSVVASLTGDGFLNAGALDVIALPAGRQIRVLVYLQKQLIAQTSLALNPENLAVQST